MHILYKLLILSLAVMLVSCFGAGGDDPGKEYAPNMYHAVPYEPLKQITDESAGGWVSSIDDGVGEYYSSNPNNPYGMNMREPVPNTVRRSDRGYLPYRIPKDSIELAARVLKNPLDSTETVISQGKVLYSRMCIHCHGSQGMGDGLVGKVFLGVTPYTSRTVKDKPGGHIFHVITHGKGRMGSHASQLSVDERWQIVRYVQVLQNQ